MKQKTLNTIILLLLYQISFAQKETILLNVIGQDSLETKVINNLNYNSKFKNVRALKKELNNIQKQLVEEGYFNITLQYLKKTTDSTRLAKLNLYNKYSTIKIYFDPKAFPKKIITKLSNQVEENNFTIPIEQLDQAIKNINNYYSLKGHPFNKARLQNIILHKQQLRSTLYIDKKERRSITDIKIKGYQKFPKGYIRQYLSLKNNKPFSKNTLETIPKDINSLTFAKSIKQPELLFQNDSTNLYLYIDKKTANTFDGFLGFSNNQNNNTSLNGYININLINNLNFGEKLNIVYKNDGNQQQQFYASTNLPFIFKSPLDISLDIEIFKRDSTFTTTTQQTKLSYQINSKSKASIGYQTSTSSNLLNTQTEESKLSNYRSSFFQAAYYFTKRTNHHLFPIKTNLVLTSDIGNRKSNNTITPQSKGNLKLEHLIKLNPTNFIYIQNQTLILFSKDFLTNELYRFGGINSIRGFNENSINASLFSLLNTEYRIILSKNIYLNSIIDYGYFEDNTINLKQNLTAFGFGLGLQTPSGIFKIIFANGKTNEQPFNFSNTKVHFSISTNF